MRKILAGACAALMFLSPLSWAAEFKDGNIPSNGVAPGSQAVGGWDGTSQRTWRVDPNGIGRVTEEYPITSQRVSYTAAAAVGVTIGLKAIGNGYAIAPYGRRTLRLTRAITGNASSPMYVYLYSSDDNVTFKPLLAAMGTSGTPIASNALAALQDTAKVDTVMIALPTVVSDAWYSIPRELSCGRYVQIWARRDSSTSTVTTSTLGATWELREE